MRYLLLLFFLTACGTDDGAVIDKPIPNPGPNPGPGDGPDFKEITTIHQQYCVGCHANSAFIRDETSLRASSAERRVSNFSMPPPSSVRMPSDVRDRYLSFF